MKSRLLFVGRQKEIEWLDRMARVSPILVVVGVRGIGKTWLIRHWTEKSEGKCRWFSADRLKSLSELLGQEGDAESALEQVTETWKGLDAVVWDDIEQIHPKARHTLLSFLRATPGLPLQIVISDEEVSREFLMDFAQMKLGPLSRAELRDFLVQTGGGDLGNGEDAVLDLERKTGGVPLLVKLWLQSPETASMLVHSLLEGLGEIERRLFSLSAVLGRAITQADISDLAGEKGIERLVENLVRKNLFERLQGPADSYRVPSFIRNLFLKEADAAERTALKRELLRQLATGRHADPFELFLLAVDLQDFPAADRCVLDVPLEKLESLSTADLREALKGLAAVAARADGDLAKRARFARLHTRAMFLLGMRAEALEIAEKYAQKSKSSGELTAEEQYFILEYVQLLNRNSQFAKAQKTARAFIQHFRDPIHSLLSVELAVSAIPTSLPESREILQKTLKRAEQAIQQGNRDRDWLLVRTQANFQLGRALDLADEWKSSERHFALAYETYRQDLDQTYFAAVAAMNRAWLLFQMREWDALGEVTASARLEAEKFGYHYVLAGLSIIEAGRHRYFLHPSAALQKIELGLKFLGASPPMQPMVDAGAERVRVFLQLGLRARARQEFRRIESLVQENPDSIVLDQQESLRLEIDTFDLGLSEWIERWDSSKHGREPWRRLSTRTGMTEVTEKEREELRRFPLGRIAVVESDLVRAFQRGARDEVWRHVAEFEQALAETTDPCAERIALLLLQMGLVEEPERRVELGQQVEIELLRWGCDQEVKAPLHAWLNAARSEKKDYSPEKDPLWKKAAVGDRDRWRRWWEAIWRKEAKKYKVHTLQKAAETDDAPGRKDMPKGLYVSDELAEVICNGKTVKELGSRHSLRRLLSLILECYPQSVTKATLAGAIWGESYNPAVHDSRVYTSVQRVRTLVKLKDCIQSLDNGYRWNPKIPFVLIKATQQELVAGEGNPRVQALVLHALESFAQSGRPWVSRSELVEVAGASDATVKRELARLISEGLITRRGAGRAVEYAKAAR